MDMEHIGFIKNIIKNKDPEIANIVGKTVMISINRSYTEKNIYEATRLAWREKKEKIEAAELVLSTVNGFIVGAFIPSNWFDVEVEDHTRVGFEGDEAPLFILNQYIGKRVPEEYRKQGHAAPVKYSKSFIENLQSNNTSNIETKPVNKTETQELNVNISGYLVEEASYSLDEDEYSFWEDKSEEELHAYLMHEECDFEIPEEADFLNEDGDIIYRLDSNKLIYNKQYIQLISDDTEFSVSLNGNELPNIKEQLLDDQLDAFEDIHDESDLNAWEEIDLDDDISFVLTHQLVYNSTVVDDQINIKEPFDLSKFRINYMTNWEQEQGMVGISYDSEHFNVEPDGGMLEYCNAILWEA